MARVTPEDVVAAFGLTDEEGRVLAAASESRRRRVEAETAAIEDRARRIAAALPVTNITARWLAEGNPWPWLG